MMLSDVCLSVSQSVCIVCLKSVAYIGPTSRTERVRKTKIGTEVDHVTRDSSTIVKVKRSKVKITRHCGWLYRQANMDIELVTDPDACTMYILVTACRPGRRY